MMRRLPSKFAALAVAAALWLTPAASLAVARAPQVVQPVQSYVLIDLSPAGSAGSSAAGASGLQQAGSAGFISGAGQTPVNHAMLWGGSGAGVIDLGVGTALAVGDGQQAGGANNHAAVWLRSARRP